jgi:alpha-tubulin suppressor-like RCC1 family protein
LTVVRRLFRHACFGVCAASALFGCSLLTDLDGYTGGTGAATDAAPVEVDASSAPDGASDASIDQVCDPGDAAVDPTLLSDAVDIVVGGNFSCALRAGGTVVCWGDNGNYQLGTTGADRSSPVTVNGLTGVLAITAGGAFACAIDGDHHAWCWGSNTDGQIGIGTTDTTDHLPTEVRGPQGNVLEGVTLIRGGDSHACAVAGGQLVCWGANGDGQLGRLGSGPVAGAVAGLTNVTELATAGNYTCAIADDTGGGQTKAVYCWGSNSDLQLGLPDAAAATPAPQRISVSLATPDGLPILAGGWGQVCARDPANALWCWGENDFGQLGAGLSPGPPNATPQRMTDLGTVRMAASGDDFSCAVRADSSVWCLGENDLAELGNGLKDVVPEGGSAPPHTSPTPVSNLGAVDRIASFNNHSCAILAHPCASTGAQVECWGANGSGQLGGGNTSTSKIAVSVRAP